MNKIELKKKVLIILCLLLLLSPVLAEDAVLTEGAAAPQQTETVVDSPAQEQEETKGLQYNPPAQQNKITYKEPVSKRKIAMKFIYAMLGVAISSILLFILLTIYNKIRSKVVQPPSSDYTNTLATPNNLKDAVNIYLEKTK